MRLTLWKPS